MRTKTKQLSFPLKGEISRIFMLAVAVMAAVSYANAEEEEDWIDRYKVDFVYQGVQYQILSESEKTVAVAQDYDIDFNVFSQPSRIMVPGADEIGENGFLDYIFTVIPPTVYDENGTAYTVTAIAHEAIQYDLIHNLVLPPTLKNLNGGIGALPIRSIYLPEGLQKLDGVYSCPYLENLYIPASVESISGLMRCGIRELYIPPSVKTIRDRSLSYCDSLSSVMISGVETMGKKCFEENGSLLRANLPETLKSMGDGCFNNCTKMLRVSLPWSEIKMNDCFNGCPSVKCIEVLAEEPYPFPDNCFKDVDRSKCDLLVPVESLEKYQAAEGWNEFYRINYIPTSGVVAKKADKDADFTATAGKGLISIVNTAGKQIDVAAANGEKMATVTASGTTELPLPCGIYIVSSPTSSVKVFVR
ncbi:MAG: leucine-rich repeat protein [Bacteroidales bacterium]|nr:leucine-rich repeat protein [Bacteroidales bacterium]